MDKRQVSIVIPIIRPEGAKRCIETLIYDPSFNDFEVVTEEDKDRIGCPKMLKKLVPQTMYDWVLFLGDDTVPQAGMILKAFEAVNNLPNGWGLVGFNDQYNDGEQITTHWMGHKNLLLYLDNEFFHTGYSHCFCDLELTNRCKEMGRYVFAKEAKLIHNHPLIFGKELTEDYARVYEKKIYVNDLRLYKKRERNGWKCI